MNENIRAIFEKWHLDKYPDRSLEIDDNGNYAVGTAPIVHFIARISRIRRNHE